MNKAVKIIGLNNLIRDKVVVVWYVDLRSLKRAGQPGLFSIKVYREAWGNDNILVSRNSVDGNYLLMKKKPQGVGQTVLHWMKSNCSRYKCSLKPINREKASRKTKHAPQHAAVGWNTGMSLWVLLMSDIKNKKTDITSCWESQNLDNIRLVNHCLVSCVKISSATFRHKA